MAQREATKRKGRRKGANEDFKSEFFAFLRLPLRLCVKPLPRASGNSRLLADLEGVDRQRARDGIGRRRVDAPSAASPGYGTSRLTQSHENHRAARSLRHSGYAKR